MDPTQIRGAVFANPSWTGDWAWFFGVLGAIGIYGIWITMRQHGLAGLLPWDTEQVTRGMEDEALGVYLSDPKREWSAEVLLMAGRAALRRLEIR